MAYRQQLLNQTTKWTREAAYLLDKKKLLTGVSERKKQPRDHVQLYSTVVENVQGELITKIHFYCSTPLLPQDKVFCSQVVRHLEFNINVFTNSSNVLCLKERAVILGTVGANYQDAFIVQPLLQKEQSVL